MGMNNRKFMTALRLVGIGWYIASCVVIGIGGGIWLDNRLNTLPLFALLGILFGTILAFYGIYKMVGPLMNRSHDNNASQGPEDDKS